jgi:S1-C subfamily serine protease
MVAGLCSGYAATALAQPALERLEQQVRERSPGAGDQTGAGIDNTGYLGVVADDRMDSGKGVRIVQIIPGSPAEQAGLKTDDLVTAVAGKPVRSMDDLARILSPMVIGSRVTFEYKRDRKTQELEVTLGRRPPEGERPFQDFGMLPQDAELRHTPDAHQPGLLGVRVEGVTEELMNKLNLPSTDGAFIVHVNPGSPAARAELPLQGVIVAIDDSQVSTTADLKRLVAAAGAGATVKVSYYAQGDLREAAIRLAGAPGPAAPAGPLPLVGPWRLPPNLPNGPPALDAERRLELLEQRMERLEQRLGEIERLLKGQAGKPEGSEGTQQ